MNNFDTILLGIIQGLAEFLPISSSGHLVLFQKLLGFREPELLLDVVLHLGTLFSVCIYFRSDLKDMLKETWEFCRDLCRRQKGFRDVDDKPSAALTLMVVIGTIPTCLIGLAFQSQLERLFGSVTMVGFALLTTGFILLISRYIPENGKRKGKIILFTALCIGVAQGFAIVPGISRSGTTIVCGMILGLRRELAARYSFLLSIPAIIGAMVVQLYAHELTGVIFLPLASGFLSAAIVGLIALKIVMDMVKKGKLFFFSPYCWAIGLLAIGIGYMAG
ncbi:MAG: undecaprenyl-diphosphate phosphatase [Deltaproteobacteria bacterium]|jgi:undecaprenyl-diphosphatase|nr:undecaprenyl-diphosphate phosphatase [Deltaproteobacteria bacterium]